MSKRKRESSKVWARRVSAWRSSGLSGGKFARQQGLKESTLYRWGRRVDDESTVPAPEATFAQVRVRSPPALRPSPRPASSSAMIEVVLTGGRVLRLLGPVDAGQLRAVVEALEAC